RRSSRPGSTPHPARATRHSCPRRRWRRAPSCQTCSSSLLLVLFTTDEVVDPPQLPLARLEPRQGELADVPAGRAVGRLALPLAALLEHPPAFLEDADARLARGAVEEREVQSEPVIREARLSRRA